MAYEYLTFTYHADKQDPDGNYGVYSVRAATLTEYRTNIGDQTVSYYPGETIGSENHCIVIPEKYNDNNYGEYYVTIIEDNAFLKTYSTNLLDEPCLNGSLLSGTSQKINDGYKFKLPYSIMEIGEKAFALRDQSYYQPIYKSDISINITMDNSDWWKFTQSKFGWAQNYSATFYQSPASAFIKPQLKVIKERAFDFMLNIEIPDSVENMPNVLGIAKPFEIYNKYYKYQQTRFWAPTIHFLSKAAFNNWLIHPSKFVLYNSASQADSDTEKNPTIRCPFIIKTNESLLSNNNTLIVPEGALNLDGLKCLQFIPNTSFELQISSTVQEINRFTGAQCSGTYAGVSNTSGYALDSYGQSFYYYLLSGVSESANLSLIANFKVSKLIFAENSQINTIYPYSFCLDAKSVNSYYNSGKNYYEIELNDLLIPPCVWATYAFILPYPENKKWTEYILTIKTLQVPCHMYTQNGLDSLFYPSCRNYYGDSYPGVSRYFKSIENLIFVSGDTPAIDSFSVSTFVSSSFCYQWDTLTLSNAKNINLYSNNDLPFKHIKFLNNYTFYADSGTMRCPYLETLTVDNIDYWASSNFYWAIEINNLIDLYLKMEISGVEQEILQTNITINSQINNKYCFYKNKSITNITINGAVAAPTFSSWLKGSQVQEITAKAEFFTENSLPKLDWLNKITISGGSSLISLNQNTLSTLVLPNTITEIGELNCYALSRVNITDLNSFLGIQSSLGEGLFSHSSAVNRDIYLNNNLLTEVENDNIIEVSSILCCCTSLQSVSFPAATTISTRAFAYCTNLQSVSLPAVTTIDSEAFSGCTSLQSVELSNLLTSIGISAFSRSAENPNPITVYYWDDENIPNWYNITFYSYNSNPFYQGLINSRLIRKYIEDGVEKEENIISITVPNSVTEIKNYAFYGCSFIMEFYGHADIETMGESCIYTVGSNYLRVPFIDTAERAAQTVIFKEYRYGNSVYTKGGRARTLFWDYRHKNGEVWGDVVEENKSGRSMPSYGGTVLEILTGYISPNAASSFIKGYHVYRYSSDVYLENTYFEGGFPQVIIGKDCYTDSSGGKDFFAATSCSSLGQESLTIPNSTLGGVFYTYTVKDSIIFTGQNLESISLFSPIRSSSYNTVYLYIKNIKAIYFAREATFSENCNIDIVNTQGQGYYGTHEASDYFLNDLQYFGPIDKYEPGKFIIPEGIKNLTLSTDLNYCNYINTIEFPESLQTLSGNIQAPSINTILFKNAVTSIARNIFKVGSSLTNLTLPFVGLGKEGANPVMSAIFDTGINFSNLKYLKILNGNIDTNNKKYISNISFGVDMNLVELPDDLDYISSNCFIGSASVHIKDLNIPFIGEKIASSASDVRSFQAMFNSAIPSLQIDNVNISTGNLISGSNKVTILKDTFKNTSGIKNINLPRNLEVIGIAAFENCIDLVGLDIPETVNMIYHDAFKILIDLTKEININIQDESSFVNAFKDGGVSSDYTTLVAANNDTTKYKNSSNIRYILINFNAICSFEWVNGLDSSMGCKLVGITSWNDNDNKELNILTNVPSGTPKYAGAAIIQIGNGTNSLSYPAGYAPTQIHIYSGPTTIAQNAFKDLSDLTEVTFSPDATITIIDDGAFQGCSGLTELKLPRLLTPANLGKGVFNGCESLKKTTTTAGLTSSSPNIKDHLTVSGTNYYGNCLFDNNNVLIAGYENTSIPEVATCEEIGENAFYGTDFSSLDNPFKIPKNIKTIRANAFEEITAPEKGFETESLDYWLNIDFANPLANPLNIETSLCQGEKILSDITISQNKIKNYAFYDCSSLTKITFNCDSDDLSIGTQAFYDCQNLEELVFSKDTKVKNDIRGCFGLDNITTITTCGENIFYLPVDKITTLTINGGHLMENVQADNTKIAGSHNSSWDLILDGPDIIIDEKAFQGR